MMDMKDRVLEILKEHNYLNMEQIAHELYMKISDIRIHIDIAIKEKKIIFDEKNNSYHYNFELNK